MFEATKRNFGTILDAYSSTKTVSGTLDFLGDYFKTPFALPKLDVVAFPQYTGKATALENWGLVCGIYKGVLVDPIYSGPEEYESVAHVMAHEIAHQWFGNYVTLREWRWLFLNEAFANYWFTHGVNHAFPKQHQMSKLKRFWILEKALRSDANPRRSTAVISDEGRLFGYQSYHKGSSLLGMLNYTLGDKVLQIGVTNYLHNNAYGTATPESLWTELTKAAKGLKGWEENRPLNVGEMMKTWMEKKGFPLISVRTEDGRLMFEQKSMLPEDKTTTWVIPIFVQTKNGEEMHYFYGKDGTNKYWKERKLSDGWQVINAGAKSFIRVWYDDNSWNPIFDQLKRNSKVFDELTKAKFISDIAVQAEQDARFWPRLLTLMSEYLSQETEFAPLHTASSIMDKLWINFRRSEMKGDVERFLRKCLGQYVKNSLWAKSDNWKTQMMNSMVTDFACKYNAEQCRDTAGTFFNEFLNNCEYTGEGTGSCIRQPPELRKPVYCYGLRRKPEAVPTLTRMHNWFYEHSRYFTKDAEDMLNGISCVEGKNLESVISKAINGLYPPEIFDNIADNDDSGLELWNYFVSNVEHVVFGVPSFADYIGAATDGWNTQKDIDRIEQFMTSEKGAALSTDNHQLLETAKKNIRENIKWMSTHGKAVSEWIKSKSTFTARIEA
ncbi:hypothetical protein AB6A40_000680 [Gnathostoma spinigerum]|uniref:Aminopeptidase N n=1 Tax=Gnathostoma spinigerum TaxID=75299 RepID=A0ABD6E3T5_9BILA